TGGETTRKSGIGRVIRGWYPPPTAPQTRSNSASRRRGQSLARKVVEASSIRLAVLERVRLRPKLAAAVVEAAAEAAVFLAGSADASRPFSRLTATFAFLQLQRP